MAAEMIDDAPLTVLADDARDAQRLAAALRQGATGDAPRMATIVMGNGQATEIAPSLVVALQWMATLLAQGDDVALVPVHKEVSLSEAAALLDVPPPFVAQLLDASVIPATGTGEERRVKMRDLLLYKERQSADNRRDLATALAVAQEAGAYD